MFSSASASARFSDRVLARLEQAEQKETDPWARDDIRIAWITVMNARQGRPNPHITATYAVLGIHPDKVWPSIVARRKAALGASYEDFFGVKLPPKKPVEAVRLRTRAASAA